MKRRLPLLAALAVATARGGAQRRFSVRAGRNITLVRGRGRNWRDLLAQEDPHRAN
jgi:hypothetical protein